MLAELVRTFGGSCELAAGEGPRVRDVQLDSRHVERGDLFAALAGSLTDGARFVPDAVRRGAVAVLAPRALAELEETERVPLWVHPGARALVGPLAALLHGHPARGMLVVAVTGTNGKTTTAHLIAQVLEHCGRRPASIGTTGNRLADGAWQRASYTTPDAPELWRLIDRHRRLGGDSLVLEASSHALVQERLAGLEPTIAVFTNLSRDHLDYHGSMAEYARAKARLFSALGPGGAAVVNAGDPWAETMIDAARERGARIVTYAVHSSEEDARKESRGNSAGSRVDLSASLLRTDLQGTFLTSSGMGLNGVGLRLPLLGRHNAENALAALAAVLLSGESPSTAVEGLSTVQPPPGRLEPVGAGAGGPRVFVDYAHTEDALRNAATVLRQALEAEGEERAGGRLLVVFGCGGERDPGKRAPMGRVAGELADLAVITSDNPRGEDPAAILSEILRGAEQGRAQIVVEPDRRAAIRAALRAARPEDVVLVAGKGHEAVQVVGEEALPFDDRVVVAEELG